MATLVYKRTHDGDPDKQGVFGNHGCMGRIRGYEFDAVIGIGGVGAWAQSCGIDEKINWIGVGPHEVGKCQWGYPQLAFEHFVLFEERGARVRDKAKALARRFCHAKAPRFAINTFSKAELAEIEELLASVKNAPPSPGLFHPPPVRKRKCPPKHRRKC